MPCWDASKGMIHLHVGHDVRLHVGYHVHLHIGHHVGHYNVVSTLCEGSETLTGWKSESVTNRRTDRPTDWPEKVLEMLAHLKKGKQKVWKEHHLRYSLSVSCSFLLLNDFEIFIATEVVVVQHNLRRIFQDLTFLKGVPGKRYIYDLMQTLNTCNNKWSNTYLRNGFIWDKPHRLGIYFILLNL